MASTEVETPKERETAGPLSDLPELILSEQGKSGREPHIILRRLREKIEYERPLDWDEVKYRHNAAYNEKKLNRLQGKSAKEPTSKEIISSLAKAKEDLLESLLQGRIDALVVEEECSPSCDVNSSFQRHLHPQRQAIDSEELKSLLSEDDLAKRTALQVENEELLAEQANKTGK